MLLLFPNRLLVFFIKSPDSISLLYEQGITMNQSLENAINALQSGQGVVVTDDYDRENEGDVIFSAQNITQEQVALLIRECSGIVCLCLDDAKVQELELPMMSENNRSRFQTAFTVSIEAKDDITTGVSAQDRLKTIQAAISQDGASKIVSPGHIFPLKAKKGGVLERRGHTEASVELMKLANLKPYAVLCELTNQDGTMKKGKEIIDFAQENSMPIITIEQIARYFTKQKEAN